MWSPGDRSRLVHLVNPFVGYLETEALGEDPNRLVRLVNQFVSQNEETRKTTPPLFSF
jgi:hypothetical protein